MFVVLVCSYVLSGSCREQINGAEHFSAWRDSIPELFVYHHGHIVQLKRVVCIYALFVRFSEFFDHGEFVCRG